MAKPVEVDPAALAAALADLYAVVPDEFVTTRTALVQDAKARGDVALAKEVGRLRRPTVAAWVVNAVVREHPDRADSLDALGRRMRAAQAQLDVAALSALRKDRDELLARWVDAASEVAPRAGRPLTAAVGEEVRATLIAALAGEEATRAVLSGHLTRALSYSGFGDVDLSEAVARTSSGTVLSVVEGRRPASEPAAETARKAEKPRQAEKTPKAEKPPQAENPPKAEKPRKADTAYRAEAAAEDAEAQERQRRVEAARESHAAAVEAAQEASLAVDQARDRADEARWQVEEIEARLKQARSEHRDAEQAATAAARARRAAQVEVAKAERALREAESGRA